MKDDNNKNIVFIVKKAVVVNRKSNAFLYTPYPNIVSVKYHHALKGAIIFFSLLSVPFFSEKSVIIVI